VLLKFDTLGDLVLFAPVLRALRNAWSDTRIAVVIRRAYLDLAPLLAPGIEWLATSLDPFGAGPEADPGEVHRLRELITTLQPDLVAAATSRRNWLEVALAAAAPHARRLAQGAAADDAFFATRLRLALGLHASNVFTENIPPAGNEPDWRANFHLVDALLGRPVERVAPRVTLTDPARKAAEEVLRAHQLEAGRYVVCAAAGFANVRLKTWSANRFATAVAHLQSTHQRPTLLIGQESERAYLTEVRNAAIAALGDEAHAPRLWLGREGDLPTLAALIASSKLFLGNDTGAMHLAAAVDIPVVAIFGGGTWPRFVPAARRGAAVVHPLPCFGCGWDCAFGDAPCLGEITAADAIAALDLTLGGLETFHVRPVSHLTDETRTMMDKAATTYRASSAGHLARQHKLEELTALDREKDRELLEKDAEISEKDIANRELEVATREKDAEIAALKHVCDEREKTIIILDGYVRQFQSENGTIKADNAILEKTLAALPADAAKAAQTISDQLVHIRNLEALLGLRMAEIAELQASVNNRAGGLHDLEQAKHYNRLLAQKEAAIQSLHEGLAAREHVILQLSAEATTGTAKLRKAWIAATTHLREKLWRPFDAWLFHHVVENHWMQIGMLRHYAPRLLKWDERLPGPTAPDAALPQLAIVTPSYGQEKYIERTLRSVLDQVYPKLVYVVQDGGSKDLSAEIIARYASRLYHWESVKDKGQADAIQRGFAHITARLGPNDVMAWLNSDDLLAPGSLRFVAEYFNRHPDVDVVYGHRIIIDDADHDVGRWIMPRHHPATLEWVDYVPQETLFWRKRAWDLAGGIDPSFQFALDWDLLARFQQAGCRMVRVPYFLGAFRVHDEQKTSQAIHTTGADEMRRIRTRFHGEKQDDFRTINRYARHTRFWGAITARLHEVGVRW
jgi:ADP-heptose:LPS heptosyltransferase/GT2 family glycosyltransferase